MASRKKSNEIHGYHIARSAINPSTKYLQKNNEFGDTLGALHFMDHIHAHDYAKKHGIEIGDLANAIVPCKCPQHIRDRHPTAEAYF